MAKTKIGGLGKGLDALFVDNTIESVAVTSLPISEVTPNKEQPRKEFDGEALAALTESVKEHGILQPIVVRPIPGGGYVIVAGERRWRAAMAAGLSELPVVVKDMSDLEAMEIALIENLLRQDLSPIEVALGYKSLIEQFGQTQEEVSRRVGRSRSAVANTLRLLSLSDSVITLLKDGKITEGHAKALCSLAHEDADEIAELIIKDDLTVRKTEELVKQKLESSGKPPRPPRLSPYREFELALGEKLSRRIKVAPGKEGSGTLSLEFFDRDELMRMAELLEKLMD